MNTIKYEDKNIKDDIVIKCDTIIYYINSTVKLNIKVLKDVKLFEYFKDSKVENKYYFYNNTIFDRFNIDSNIITELNLETKGINIDYFYSCINISDNLYKLDVIHNAQDTTSSIINNGINLKSNKLDFVVNGIVKKNSINVTCNQNNKIINLEDNTSSIKPNLIVDNNDVSLGHSAYIGDFNHEALFYLACRGIDVKTSRKLLAKAFLTGDRDILFSEKELIFKEIEKNWR